MRGSRVPEKLVEPGLESGAVLNENVGIGEPSPHLAAAGANVSGEAPIGTIFFTVTCSPPTPCTNELSVEIVVATAIFFAAPASPRA